jgi:hypothetical protein
MFRPNWLPSSSVPVAEETATPLSRCYILHSKDCKILIKYLKIILTYYAVIILLYARVVGLVYILLSVGFSFVLCVVFHYLVS